MAGEAKAVRAEQPLSLSGSHKISAIVDDINRYPESNEQNNGLIKQLDFGSGPTPSLAQPMAAGTTQVIQAVKTLALQGKQTITAIVDDVNRYPEQTDQNNALTKEIVF